MGSRLLDRREGSADGAVAELLADIDRLTGPVPEPWTRVEDALGLDWPWRPELSAFRACYTRVHLALVERVAHLAPAAVTEELQGHGEYTLQFVSAPGWVDYNTILYVLLLDRLHPGYAPADLVAEARRIWSHATPGVAAAGGRP